MNFKKLLTVNNILKALVIGTALIAGIIYLTTATTWYLQGNVFDPLVFVFALLSIVVVVASAIVDLKFPKFGSFLLLIAALFLALSLTRGILDRVNFIGDSFIPMDYPPQFYQALNGTYTSLVMFGVAIIVLAVSCFIPEISLQKDELE